MSTPVKTHVIYRPKPGKEEELFALVQKHWPTLSATGLVTGEKAVVYRATNERTGERYFIEIFSWRDEQASSIAHQTPEVMSVWEPMGPILASLEIARIDEVGAEAHP